MADNLQQGDGILHQKPKALEPQILEPEVLEPVNNILHQIQKTVQPELPDLEALASNIPLDPWVELNNLWDEAYGLLRAKNAKLVEAYEQDLLSLQDIEQHGALPRTGRNRQSQLQDLVRQKLQDIQDARMKFTVDGREVVVKEQLLKVVGLIQSASSFIGAAISAEPLAALAWAGVVVILPVSSRIVTYTFSY